jgi:hypothetical protein
VKINWGGLPNASRYRWVYSDGLQGGLTAILAGKKIVLFLFSCKRMTNRVTHMCDNISIRVKQVIKRKQDVRQDFRCNGLHTDWRYGSVWSLLLRYRIN